MTRSRIRTEAACLESLLKSVMQWNPNDPKAGTVSHNFSLDSQIARARSEMGPDRWNELQAEWHNKERMGL